MAVDPAKPIGDLSDAEARAFAFDLYCTMGIPHIPRIAQKVGRSREQINQWKEEGRWLEARTIKQEEILSQKQVRIEKLLKKVESEDKCTIRQLRMAKEFQAMLLEIRDQKPTAGEAKSLCEALERTVAIQTRCYEKLKK